MANTGLIQLMNVIGYMNTDKMLNALSGSLGDLGIFEPFLITLVFGPRGLYQMRNIGLGALQGSARYGVLVMGLMRGDECTILTDIPFDRIKLIK